MGTASPEPIVLELRGLEPPEPMMRILRTLEGMAVGQRLEARLPRKPVFFLPQLEELGYPYDLEHVDEELWVLRITKE